MDLQKLRNKIVEILIGISLLTLPASAEIILQNPDFSGDAAFSDQDGGSNLPQLILEDFNISSGETIIEKISWWGVYANSNTPQPVDDFSIQIFNTVNPTPIHSAKILSNERLLTGDQYQLVAGGPVLDVYQFSADIDPFDVNSEGTYFLSIFNDTREDNDDRWAWMSGFAENSDTWFRSSTTEDWTQFGGSFAFVVETIPEPSTYGLFALMITGLMALGYTRGKLFHK